VFSLLALITQVQLCFSWLMEVTNFSESSDFLINMLSEETDKVVEALHRLLKAKLCKKWERNMVSALLLLVIGRG
jgi:hypothetical protein